MAENPSWHRTRLSKEICLAWHWVYENGQPKDIACRSLLRKLEAKGFITLPARQNAGGWIHYQKKSQPVVAHDTADISGLFNEIAPISLLPVEGTSYKPLFNHLLDTYHYLGFHGAVGENRQYMAFDRYDRPLACLLFGSSAWRVAARDRWIGWREEARQAHLHRTTNNTRFLVCPWVHVPHLASHLLGRVCRRISDDWIAKYNHPIDLLETFVDRSRFRGTSYQAANWPFVGQTKGRSRQDRFGTLQVPVKDIYLYPLHRKAKEVLSDADSESVHAHLV